MQFDSLGLPLLQRQDLVHSALLPTPAEMNVLTPRIWAVRFVSGCRVCVSWPLALLVFMPLTGNVINEPIIYLIGHQSILCVYVRSLCMTQTWWKQPSCKRTTSVVNIEINAHDSTKSEKKGEQVCFLGFFEQRMGQAEKWEFCVCVFIASDCKCSSKTTYRVGNQQPLPWHSRHRLLHFAFHTHTHSLTILARAFHWLHYFLTPDP